MTIVTSVWRNAQFRRVWGAGAISTLGGEIGELAIPVLALVTLAASASELSFVRAALLVPYLLLTLWLGVVVDRSRRRPLMIAADIARGVLLALVCWFAVAGWLTIPMLIVAAVLLGSLTVLYAMADFAFLPLIVEEHELLDANARITATQSAIAIAGAGEIFTIALTILILQDYELGPLIFGMVLMSGGVGAFLGSVSSRRLTERFGYGRALIGSLVLGNTAPLVGIIFAGTSSVSTVVALTTAFFVSGVGIGVANSQSVSIRQLAVPPEVRGRVNAGYRLASWGFLSLGALAGGVLVSVAGSWTAAVIGAVIMAMATIPVAASPARSVVAIGDLARAAL